MISIVERANPSVVDQAYLELKVVDEGIEVLNQEIANLTQKVENTRHRLVTLPKKRFLIFWQHETPTHDSLRFHISNLNKKIEGLNERVADRRKERRHVVHLIAQQEKIIREVEPIQKQLKKEGIVVFNDDFWRQTNEKRQQALPNNSRVSRTSVQDYSLLQCGYGRYLFVRHVFQSRTLGSFSRIRIS
ncbi:hypothetical protein ACT5GY_04215 [Lactiplantibacillus plantarum]